MGERRPKHPRVGKQIKNYDLVIPGLAKPIRFSWNVGAFPIVFVYFFACQKKISTWTQFRQKEINKNDYQSSRFVDIFFWD